jgi:hypothetical protein
VSKFGVNPEGVGQYLAEISLRRSITQPLLPWSSRNAVRQVIVVLTGSRSGSTYFKQLLSKHTAVASLPGEEEPYYALTGNGFPWSSDSDAFEGELHNIEELALRIERDLQVDGPPSIDDWAEQWFCRLALQQDVIPTLYKVGETLLESMSVSGFLRHLGIDAANYDIPGVRCTSFTRSWKLEEPPFVTVPYKAKLDPTRIGDYTLLFKTPQNAYRPRLFERLYPNARIRYVHLTRGVVQTVNGLMSGWECGYGFFAHNMGQHWNRPLSITGYSDKYEWGSNWWKFDLPPNWHAMTTRPLVDVCLNQWWSAHRAVLSQGAYCAQPYQVKFEDLLHPIKKHETWVKLLEYLELGYMTLPTGAVTMSTDDPEPFRWRKSRPQLAELADRPLVQGLMGELNYSLDPTEWA